MSSSYDADNACYGHILSRKSISLQRDTFFFANRQFMVELLLGVNQKFTPMTCARLNCWLNILSACNGPLEVVVCAVEVEVVGVMGYIMKPSGAFFDQEPLPPGNYGIYFNHTFPSQS
ncbi:hypothetical protein DFH07DRAFT_1065987 [Mycena maculata]|uniref:Uncharacterized protein n=1 Tax=Mycena maculata TaxID=230809 RepID=A0AAD7HYY3_9AGAR|nr:hypothetical protein DFH07DRAFT_1065987 [Mycena maculata]